MNAKVDIYTDKALWMLHVSNVRDLDEAMEKAEEYFIEKYSYLDEEIKDIQAEPADEPVSTVNRQLFR